MPKRSSLPRPLLTELGRIASTWAQVEREILLHASALAAQETDGLTTKDLLWNFNRLRNEWYKLAAQTFDAATINKVAHPLNVDLARLSEERHHAVHGTWTCRKRGHYRVVWMRQKTRLEITSQEVSLAELRELATDIESLLRRVRRFTSGQHSPKD